MSTQNNERRVIVIVTPGSDLDARIARFCAAMGDAVERLPTLDEAAEGFSRIGRGDCEDRAVFDEFTERLRKMAADLDHDKALGIQGRKAKNRGPQQRTGKGKVKRW